MRYVPNKISLNSLRHFKESAILEKKWDLFISLIFFAIFLSIWYSLWTFNGSISEFKQNYSLLVVFNVARAFFLHPLLWYVIFALSLNIIYKSYNKKIILKLRRNVKSSIILGKTIAVVLIVIQATYLFTFYNDNYEEKTGGFYQYGGVGLIRSNQMTFNEFFSPDLFEEIDEYIFNLNNLSKDEYRVVSIGMPPAVAQYNGYYTLDSYQPNYPLEYKHQFRKIMADELEKNETIKTYFDSWGSRCYIFTSEFGIDYSITKDRTHSINMDFNSTAFKEMGGVYIFSTVEIENYQHNNLTFHQTFENDESPWKIWLYEAK